MNTAKRSGQRRWIAVIALAVVVMGSIGFASRDRSALAAAPWAPPAPDWRADREPQQIMVGLRSGASCDSTSALRSEGLNVLETIPALNLAVVETLSTGDMEAVAADLVERDIVAWAEPNYRLTLDLIPNDPDYVSHQLLYLSKLEMDTAWSLTIGRPEVVVAVVDTGVNLTHQDLAGGIWVNTDEVPANGLDDDDNGYVDDVHGYDFADGDSDPDDSHGHGTHVAGIIGARIDNNVGIAGMAGAVTLMPVDIFASNVGTYADLIRGIIYATDNGAQIINLSLGASSYSRGEEAAVEYALAHDVMVIAAAGNTGRSVYHYPAAHPGVVGVAATDARDNIAGYSGRGDFVDVAAPGSSIWSTYRAGQYTSMSGTSMATPHVSGLAALILSLNPTLKPAEVAALITANADDLGTPGRDDLFGYGRINAARTLAAVPPQSVPSPTATPHAPLAQWPSGCTELIAGGDFETSPAGEWILSGDAQIDDTRSWSGSSAAHFEGGPGKSGTMTITVVLPAHVMDGAMAFAFRIETSDLGWGSVPEAPYDDSFSLELQSADGQLIASLLRTGNTADNEGDGLSWDQYIYRMSFADVRTLWPHERVNLVFYSQNDGDTSATDVWVDGVRLSATAGYAWYLPWMPN